MSAADSEEYERYELTPSGLCVEYIGKTRPYCEKCLQRHSSHEQVVFSVRDWSSAAAFNVCWSCTRALCAGLHVNAAGDELFDRVNPIIDTIYSRRLYSLAAGVRDPEREARQQRWAEEAFDYLARITEQARAAERASQLKFRVQLDYSLFSGDYQCHYDESGRRVEYFGEIKDGAPHGPGLKIYGDGREYYGYFRYGREHTEFAPEHTPDGRMTFPDGSFYEGDWRRGQPHGMGEKHWADLRVYKGSWLNGKQHGHGEKRWPDGSVYVGNYAHGLKYGDGKLTEPDGTITHGPFAETASEDGNLDAPPPAARRKAVYGQPATLFDLARDAVAKFISTRPAMFRASRLRERLPSHVKPIVAQAHILQDVELSEAFAGFAAELAWQPCEHVSLRGMRLNGPDLRTLGYFLESNTSMRSLDMRHTGLGKRSVEALQVFLRLAVACEGLTSLDLGYNSVGDRGALAVAEHLHHENDCCTALNLCGNNIGQRGARALAHALAINTTLTDLDLGFNRVGTAGAAYLQPALTDSRTLYRLGLRSNNLGPSGASHIITAMKENSGCLVRVALADNHIGVAKAADVARSSLSSTYHMLRGLGLRGPSSSSSSSGGGSSGVSSSAVSEAVSEADGSEADASEAGGSEGSEEKVKEGEEEEEEQEAPASPNPDDYSATESEDEDEDGDGDGDQTAPKADDDRAATYDAYENIAEAIGFLII